MFKAIRLMAVAPLVMAGTAMANPASSLSLSNAPQTSAARVSTDAGKSNRQSGSVAPYVLGFVVFAGIVAGVAAGGDDDDTPDSP